MLKGLLIHDITFFAFRRDMKGEPISSGYLSDHETKLQDMVQQLSVESQDSRFCYLTSSEVSEIFIPSIFINNLPGDKYSVIWCLYDPGKTKNSW